MRALLGSVDEFMWCYHLNKVNLFNKIPHGTDVKALYYLFSQFYSMKLEVLFCLTYNKLLLHVEMKVFIEMCIVICI